MNCYNYVEGALFKAANTNANHILYEKPDSVTVSCCFSRQVETGDNYAPYFCCDGFLTDCCALTLHEAFKPQPLNSLLMCDVDEKLILRVDGQELSQHDASHQFMVQQ